MTENTFGKLQAKLLADAKTDPAKQRIAVFIVWLLKKDNHEDIALEIVAGKKDAPSLSGAYDAVKNEARKKAVSGCACLEDKDVYGLVVKYLKLDSCTSTEDIVEYCSGTPAPEKSVLHSRAKSPFSVDIDSLFDD